MFSSILSLAALTTGALAYTVHQVSVGGLKSDGTPNLAFWPNNFKADVGDTVVFTFHVKNHTVTQSSFDDPCSKLDDSYGNLIGFDSGFMPVASSDTNFPTFSITVQDTKPIWGYCKQLNPPSTHCQSGMVFGINSPDYGNTFDAFLYNAKSSTSQNSLLPPTSTSTSTSWAPEATSSAYGGQDYNNWNNGNGYQEPQTHKVIVGGGNPPQFFYSPSNITANVGDTVEFVFMAKNHTVTQASFGQPCRKIADTTYPSVYGFDSGFMPVSPNQTDNFPTFSIKVNDTNPIWAYCRQQAATFSHCGVGMVFSINANANSDKSFADFQNLAVWQNGTGVVQPFGPGVSAPSTPAWSYSSTPSATSYGSAGGSKDVSALNVVGDDTDDASMLKKLNNVAPIALGLLGTILALLVAVLIVGIVLLRRSPKGYAEILPTRNVSPSYAQVPVTMPSSKMRTDGTHDYDEPFVSPARYD